ncbi:MAG: glycoside hydrolase domain-containing protein [Thermomicrobiales bacterium]
MQSWLADSLRRLYPRSEAEARDELRLSALRGERVSFQVVCRTGDAPAAVAARVEGPEGANVRVRRVGYVPMPHLNTETPADDAEGIAFLPGFVPDPLYPESSLTAGPQETNSFWVTVTVGTDATPGEHILRATLTTDGGQESRHVVRLTVREAALPARRDFPVTHWFYADAIADWYRVDLFSEEFWRLIDPYFRNLVEHGQDTILTPIFTPPLDGIKRPTQLLHVERDGDGYRFDWTYVTRWLDAARTAELDRFEWSHLFSQWGARHAIRIYRGHGEDGTLLWDPETPGTSETYRRFLTAFLPAFERFLRTEGVLERSFFHLSDEPHGAEQLASYRAARELLRELAPWMRVMDALSEVEYARAGVTDTPVALLPSVPAFAAEGFPAWAYFCCVPRGRYLNRMCDTPLAKIRMSGWLLYRMGVEGFLHWGYNYWYQRQTTMLIDPFQVTDAVAWPNWGYGDPFVVYPGPDGPLDSIRWEVFAESLQDYALLQAAGVERNDPLLGEIVDFAAFPRDPRWIRDARELVMKRLA